MSKNFKHGSELREFWRVNKANYRARHSNLNGRGFLRQEATPTATTPRHEEAHLLNE